MSYPEPGNVVESEIIRLRAALEVCAGSIRVAMEKADDAPMSADAHLAEALGIAEAIVTVADATYSPAASKLRLERAGRFTNRQAMGDAIAAQIREAMEECAKIADAEKKMADRHAIDCRKASCHNEAHGYEARAAGASTIAAAIRAMMEGKP